MMRDIFKDIFKNEPLDPMEAARRNVRPALRKRFYKEATVTPNGDQFEVMLDSRPVRTPARRPLAAPSRELAQAIANEWQAQTEVIDPGIRPKEILDTLRNCKKIKPGRDDVTPASYGRPAGQHLGPLQGSSGASDCLWTERCRWF